MARANEYAVANATELLYGLSPGERFTWQFRQYHLMENLVRDGGLDKFLTWPTVLEALYTGYTPAAAKERAYLPKQYTYLAADFPYPPPPGRLSPEGASGTYLKQMFVAHLLEKHILPYGGWHGVDSVFEVGGGYGALAIVLRRLGMKGEHAVLDFRALHIIRNWYLENAGIFTENWQQVEPMEVDVLMAVHSMCEMSIDARMDVLNNVRAQYYAFSITKNWDGIDNASWFREWCKDEGLIYVDYFPNINGNHDLILASREALP
jgi:hypothetical protein